MSLYLCPSCIPVYVTDDMRVSGTAYLSSREVWSSTACIIQFICWVFVCFVFLIVCVCAPTASSFSFLRRGPNKGGAAATDLRIRSPADCLSLGLILTTAPRKESSNDRNEDEWCSERLTGGFLKLVWEKGAKWNFSQVLNKCQCIFNCQPNYIYLNYTSPGFPKEHTSPSHCLLCDLWGQAVHWRPGVRPVLEEEGNIFFFPVFSCLFTASSPPWLLILR